MLNARYHEQEAYIIAQAGVPGAVTIATNMAGRGTDIQLGGNPDMRLEDWVAAVTANGRAYTEQIAAKREEIKADVAKKKSKRSKPAASTSSAPSGMKAAVSTTSCAAARDAKATPAAPLFPVPGRRPHAHLRLAAHGRHALKRSA